MSDGKEVKRWELNPGDGCKSDRCYAEMSIQPDGDYILLSDLDRIVAEFKAREAAAYKVYQQMSATIGHDKNTIDELRAEVEVLTEENAVAVYQYKKLNQEALDNAQKTYEASLASHERVIEKYQQAVTRIWVSSDNCEHDMEPNTTMDFFRCEKCGIPSAFAAIERGGES